MILAEFLLLLLVCWTVVGFGGVGYSVLRAESSKALHNFGWMVAVWAAYLALLLVISLLTPVRTIAPGKPQCFHKLCYTVTGSEELKGYPATDSRLIRVQIDVVNHSSSGDSFPRMTALLADQNGHLWSEVPGLSGVPLGTSVQAGHTVLSQPVYKLPNGIMPAGIVLTRGGWHRLVLGDPDSLLHRPVIAHLR